MDMEGRQPETMVPTNRHPCPHCDPSWMRLEAASRQLDRQELEVERRLNEELMRPIDILIYGPGANGQKPN
jgi:hypothetical protein